MNSLSFQVLIRSFIYSVHLFQHERFVHMANEGEPEVLFLGDSLIQNMQLFEVIFLELVSGQPASYGKTDCIK